ncbi:Histidine phosphatase superfamily protein [Klebsormidium nitens]|uniref:Multiple inositol polyphosphate phosphatase 1 n=1 Tax=Klebsormidium nitens TaxID=105231 RepID=A0A1Y1IK30_KLENI|nr:Histidine phosphatase superfamily protein [Klebsormidium nitens]|eukprot:GAQ89106.1 Histidine phosphatase superfamily protein [Klebsormidium nitens]
MAPLMHVLLVTLCLAASPLGLLSAAEVPHIEFDSEEGAPFILSHISTSTRYNDALVAQGASLPEFLPKPPRETCKPVQLNLLARHGARDPTRKRAKQLKKVVLNLKAAAKSLVHEVQHVAVGDGSAASGGAARSGNLRSPPNWIGDYIVPWEGHEPVGYLVPGGEEEMYGLAKRWKQRMPNVLDQTYHPERYRIFGTQVPRASASAVAFGVGFLEGNGTLGPARHQSFAVISDTKDIDRRLRFHKTCPAYKAHKKARKPEVWSNQEPVYSATGANILSRTGLNLTAKDVGALWLLCKVEAAIRNTTNQVCSLFTKEEVLQLEWADDIELHILKGYGAPINYRMAQALLQDILESMEGALADWRGGSTKVPELGRLRFAHAETIMPLLCTLGLFQETDRDALLAAQEEELPLPPPPPYPRAWRGSVVAPFGANTALVLYDCAENKGELDEGHKGKKKDDTVGRTGRNDDDDDEEEEGKPHHWRYLLGRALALFRWGTLKPAGTRFREGLVHEDEFLVLALHNERPVKMPACEGALFCPFGVFRKRVLGPHMKGSFDKMCALTGWSYALDAWLVEGLSWLGIEHWPLYRFLGSI